MEINSYTDLLKLYTEECNKNNVISHADFELTSKCNFQCKFCYVVNDYSKDDYQLATQEWKRIIRDFYDQGMLSCNFTGGEALVRKDYKELYAYAYDLGLRIYVLSNGFCINEDILTFFKKRMPELISITLYGGSDKTYEKICKVKNGYTRVTENIKRIIDFKIPVSLKIVASPDISYDEYEKVASFCKEYNLKISLVKYMSPMRTKEKCSQLEWRMNSKDIYKIMKILNDLELTFGSNSSGRKHFFNCGYAKKRIAVSHKGELFGCLACTGLKEDITVKSISDALETLKERSSRLSKSMNMCKNCVNEGKCNKCAGFIYSETGDFKECTNYIKELVSNGMI